MFEELKVGGTYPQIAGRPEGTIFDFVGGGPVLIYNMYDPTRDEIEQCRAGHRFELKILKKGSVIWVVSKPGNLMWQDAPYSPHLSNGFVKDTEPEEGKGYGLTVMMVNARNNKIMALRLIGLQTKFSRELRKMIIQAEKRAFQ